MTKRSLNDWLGWQETLHSASIDLGLERISKVADVLKLRALPVPLITVAGTNGKGSCVAMLDAILRAAGYRTGCYTSPHLVTYNERMRIDGELISDDMLCDAFEAIDIARAETSLTYFEFGALAAVWSFLKSDVEVMILEVGLGGRLDAVNTWDADLALISSIDIDHIDWLGDDRDVIAGEKAGIMRQGNIAVCGDPAPPPGIARVARETKARLLQYGVDFSHSAAKDTWTYQPQHPALGDALTLARPALKGDFQLYNASTVISALRSNELSLIISDSHISEGLQQTQLPGRLQQLSNAPDIFADVAHNPQSAAALADYLYSNPVAGSNIALFSALNDKDLHGIIDPLKSIFDRWQLIPLAGERGRDAAQLRAELLKLGITAPLEAHDSFDSALNVLEKTLNSHDRVVAFGSFLVVSELMQSSRFN